MNRRLLLALALSLAPLGSLALTGCKTAAPAPEANPSEDAKPPTGAGGMAAKVASATIEAKSGSQTAGTVAFTKAGDQVTLTVEVNGLTPGVHAVHLHDKGDCSAPDAASAGPHWNPQTKPHGKWGDEEHGFHLGDVGNLEADAQGHAMLTLTTDKWTVGTGAPNDVVGHAIVVHASPDDLTSQPAGNAGGRIGCGVVQATTAQ